MAKLHMNKNNLLEEKKYGFGVLRLFLAILVIYEHSFTLGGFGKDLLKRIPGFDFSTALIAVMSFFVISGFLVTKSYLNSSNIIQFGYKRFLRIMPGFWFCLLITSFGFGLLIYYMENFSITNYFSMSPNGPVDFIKNNFFLLIRQYQIGELLSSNPFPFVLNGSLWTLFLEAKAYIFLGILGFTGMLKRKVIILSAYCLLVGFLATKIEIPYNPNPILRLIFDHYFLTFLTYFLGGSVLYLYKNKIQFTHKFSLFLLVIFVLSYFLRLEHAVLAVTLPYWIIYLGTITPKSVFDSNVDFSYGIYIYAFPVMQLAAYLGANTSQVIFFLTSIVLTLPLALFSWFMIEKPFLSLKNNKK